MPDPDFEEDLDIEPLGAVPEAERSSIEAMFSDPRAACAIVDDSSTILRQLFVMPELYRHWSEKHSIAQGEARLAEQRHEAARARAYLTHRAASTVGGKAYTVEHLKALTDNDQSVIDAAVAMSHAETLSRKMWGVTEALRMKQQSLMRLAQLLDNELRADPNRRVRH